MYEDLLVVTRHHLDIPYKSSICTGMLGDVRRFVSKGCMWCMKICMGCKGIKSVTSWHPCTYIPQGCLYGMLYICRNLRFDPQAKSVQKSSKRI